MTNVFDITDFGAVGDKAADCTEAIQQALDKAGETGGAVVVPPGNYLCGMLRVPKGVALTGTHAWSFGRNGGSILTLNRADVPCMLDLTGAFGCTVKGLCLAGEQLGEGIHGIMVRHGEYNGGGEEDTTTIEDCRVGSFSGDGVHLDRIWCFSVRHSMLCFNTGHGLYINGWDGFILDNWMSGNGGAGIFADKVAASLTMTGNRVEWNRLAGFYFRNSNTLNITGNYFDRSGGPALDLAAQPGKRSDTVTVTGNVFNRSGAGDFDKTPPADELDNCHVRLRRCVNAVVSGNTLRVGTNDGGTGPKSPLYGFVIERLRGCVIKDNAMLCASLKANVLDLGGHDEDVIVKDNAGADCAAAGCFWPSLRGDENIP
ncbi:MAG TPA: right-handed parallel beta-helix repeat-containing protein [Clostridiales bacterium]|nr:MAG: Pectate lyase superfamily protein [Firmicutes bacterium ADurb.Bin262]HOU09905.1 right-handed parallel beta-helix repeat-containing protein [Clostridiales bacterium]HQH62587.1 right-handed parallel beta-helix repeat-containing protein [Clostridiales bacterium]HQK73004.1 right-handed parallel beta-helix repeat-containing protein [Clostridiales bacterium]